MAIALGGLQIDPTGRIMTSPEWAVRSLGAARADLAAVMPLHPALQFGPS